MERHANDTATILAIDDDRDILLLIEQVLESAGYSALLAPSGTEGLSLARNNKIDLILLDIRMPSPDGFAVLKSLREFSYIPVIMLTAAREIKTLQEALLFGADDYVTKPFRPNELIARIKAKLRHL